MHTLILVAMSAILAGTPGGQAGTPGPQPQYDRPSRAAVAAVPLYDTKWIIDTVVEDRQATPVPVSAEPPYLVVLPAGQLHAYNGCNWLNAGASVDARTITLTLGAVTKRFCPDPVQTQSKILEALDAGTVYYEIAGDRLALARHDGRPGLLLHADG